MLAARVRATGELLPARLLDGGLVAGLLAALLVVALGENGALGPPATGTFSWAAFGLAAARVAALWWRRRYPEAVLAVQLAGALVARVWLDGDGVAVVALLVAIATVTSRRGLRAGLLAVAADLLIWLAAVAAADAPARSLLDALLRDSLFLVLGLYTGVRASYVQALRDRAERLERERELEARAAVDAERRRIARELHDVVAHHVSVMTLQAGGLEQRLAGVSGGGVAGLLPFLSMLQLTAPGGDALGLGPAGPASAAVFPLCLAATLAAAGAALARRDATVT